MKTRSYTKSNPESIKELFNNIAVNYEKGNAVLSFQTYRLWNQSLIRHVLQRHPPQDYLDLCAGTGDIALPYLRSRPNPCHAVLLDFSSEMLNIARQKAESSAFDHHRLQFIEADAESIPLRPNSIDAVTVAYGIRNIQNPLRCFEETLRVMRPGGTFGILELTKPQNPILKYPHSFYLHTLLPLMGKWVTSNKEAYEYLCNSIHEFVEPERVAVDLKETGFAHVKIKPLFGGIATIILAKKV